MLADTVEEVLGRVDDIRVNKDKIYRKPHLWDGAAGKRIATAIKSILEKEDVHK